MTCLALSQSRLFSHVTQQLLVGHIGRNNISKMAATFIGSDVNPRFIFHDLTRKMDDKYELRYAQK